MKEKTMTKRILLGIGGFALLAVVGLVGLGMIAASDDSDTHSPCTPAEVQWWGEHGVTVDAPLQTCEELK
jgi:hypothetical protein